MTTDRLRDAARRALDSLNDLIADSSDPGTEALGARFELETGLTNTPAPPPADRAALREQIAEALYTHSHPGWAIRYSDLNRDERDTYLARADAVLAVLPEPTNRAAVLRDFLWRLEQSAGDAAAEKFLDDNPELRRMAAEEQPAETQAANRDAIIADLLPVWEAVYEPGNVSDYLIGYTNDEQPAKAAAEAWMRSQAEVTSRLEWTPWGTATAMPDGYDAWFELVERHDDGVDTGPGIIVRRRIEPAVGEQPDTQETRRGGTAFGPQEGVHGHDPFYTDPARDTAP